MGTEGIMTPMPLATIVMPLRRQRDTWLRQAVTSAVLQTVPTAVLVVTSEATPASNRAVLRDLAAEHQLLGVIQRPAGEGFADAINLGFRTAETDRVGLLLTDDWLSPHAVESCLPHDADIVCTGRIAYAADGKQTLWSRVVDQRRFDAIPTLEGKASAIGHFLLFRRAAVLAVGGVDRAIGLTGADDYDLPWTLLENNATVRLVAEPLYRYRDHDGERLTLRTQQEQVRDLRRILAKHKVAADETERLVAAKARWYGVPCHVAIDDPDWSLRPENTGRVRPAAIVPSQAGGVVLHGAGEDLAQLVAELGSPVVAAESLTAQPAATSRRGSWKLRLEDGRILKGRQLESASRGSTLERLSSLLAGLPFANVLARRGDAVLEEWVPGPSLDAVAMTPDLAESIGLILGRVARAGGDSTLIGHRMRRADSLLRKLEGGLDELHAAGVMTADISERLLKRARANVPDVLEAGLVHLDFKPQNLILTPAGPLVIDNELVDHGPLDMDLARTWYLWPMTAASQSRFLRGYGQMRSTRSFLLHEAFWAIHTLGCAAAYLHRHGLSHAVVLRSLDRLAAGELPQTWVGG
jgi:glycosyltransferase involved in cell wall biosynthesis